MKWGTDHGLLLSSEPQKKDSRNKPWSVPHFIPLTEKIIDLFFSRFDCSTDNFGAGSFRNIHPLLGITIS